MKRDFRSALRVLVGMTLTAVVGVSSAQTPAQIEYERQQREYWRQQEQQRQEQQRQQQIMQENARRQQEETRRVIPGASSSPGASSAAGAGSTASATAPGSAGKHACDSSRVPDKTAAVLAGSWRLISALKRTNDMLSGMLQAQDTLICKQDIGPEFRISGKTVSWPNGASLAIEHFAHEGERWWVCTRSRQFSHEMRLASPQRLVVAHGGWNAGVMCAFERASGPEPQAAARTTTVTVASTASNATVPTTTAASSASAIQLNSVYVCGGERLVVFACSGPTDNDHCGIRYLDQVRQTPSGPIAAERGEDRGVLARKLQGCQLAGR